MFSRVVRRVLSGEVPGRLDEPFGDIKVHSCPQDLVTDSCINGRTASIVSHGSLLNFRARFLKLIVVNKQAKTRFAVSCEAVHLAAVS